MIIDILLGLIFAATSFILWSRIAEKMPQLAVIPDHAMREHIQQRSHKVHVFFLHIFHFRYFYRSHHYQDKFWSAAAKIIYKIHILFLRLDNGLIILLKRVRGNGEMQGEHKEYWVRLHEKKDQRSQKPTPSLERIPASPLLAEEMPALSEATRARSVSMPLTGQTTIPVPIHRVSEVKPRRMSKRSTPP